MPSRKLSAQWSVETSPDLVREMLHTHGAKAEDELLNVLADMITEEIDAAILADLHKNPPSRSPPRWTETSFDYLLSRL